MEKTKTKRQIYNQEVVYVCEDCLSMNIKMVNDYGVYKCEDCGNYSNFKGMIVYKYLELKEMLEILNK